MRSSGGVGLATYGNWKTSSAFGDSNPGSCAGCTHFGELEAESAVAEMTLGRIEGEHIIRILEESKGKLGGQTALLPAWARIAPRFNRSSASGELDFRSIVRDSSEARDSDLANLSPIKDLPTRTASRDTLVGIDRDFIPRQTRRVIAATQRVCWLLVIQAL